MRGEYIEAEGKLYCGNACLERTFPKCEICKGPIRKGYTITSHRYCENCVQSLPTCFSCGLPAAHPTHLGDGRDICVHCLRWAVTKPAPAEMHYDRVRRQLEAWTGLPLATLPALELVDLGEMQRLAKEIRKSDAPVSVRGLYSRQTTVTRRRVLGTWKVDGAEERECIYIVDHLHDEVFRVAAMHELMHDLIHEHFPRLADAPLWVHEGVCQQAAAEYCRRRNQVDILHGIEQCEDPDYGDGYRYIHALTGFEGWPALRRWMETVDVAALPATAPR